MGPFVLQTKTALLNDVTVHFLQDTSTLAGRTQEYYIPKFVDGLRRRQASQAGGRNGVRSAAKYGRGRGALTELKNSERGASETSFSIVGKGKRAQQRVRIFEPDGRAGILVRNWGALYSRFHPWPVR